MSVDIKVSSLREQRDIIAHNVITITHLQLVLFAGFLVISLVLKIDQQMLENRPR
jgi:hypothetical protein